MQKAYRTVIAAASTVVATPPKIPRRTITGRRMSHFASHTAPPSSSSEKGVHLAPERTPVRTPHPVMSRTSRTPGSTPPRNILSTGIPATTAYRITGRHGGKRGPSDPEAQRGPQEKLPADRLARRARRKYPP